MKIFNYLTILLTLCLLSCTDENVITNPIQRIESISLFDVGNDGKVSDMSVAFSIKNVADISQFNVLIIPSNKSNSFTKEQALLLSPDRFATVTLSNGEDYAIRLTGISDIEGNQIVGNKGYVAKILMVGRQFNQLSFIESASLTLSNQGVLNGFYEGTLVHNFSNSGSPGSTERTFVLSGQLSEGTVSDNYIGQFTTGETRQGFGGFVNNPGNTTIRFTLIDGGIDQFSADKTLFEATTGYIECDTELKGQVKSELKLEIIGNGCSEGKYEMTLTRSTPEEG